MRQRSELTVVLGILLGCATSGCPSLNYLGRDAAADGPEPIVCDAEPEVVLGVNPVGGEFDPFDAGDGVPIRFNPAGGAIISTFVNPYNNRTYRAVRSPLATDYSTGYEMLERANTLKAKAEAAGCLYDDQPNCEGEGWELQTILETIEIVRGYYDIYGYAWF